ncbi:rhodanese-like domain-containing protein [Verrucomicrobium spinosum]|uniref:rhodanese-like domain-containing protein n=1 Tax=Verrucomicrobium spinosum TaxID=2736 RepID=UPI0001746082|nr:rhodanese-like domain-containing protein [Verrucomicrobium spinosum]
MSTATVADPVSSDVVAELPPLSGATKMGALLESYPGAQRALFAKYHIGGCRSCGFQPGETLAEVCARNENIPVEEAVAFIQESYQSDASLQITPEDLVKLREVSPNTKLLDVRSREEHEAVAIPGSHLVSQELIQVIFDQWNKTDPVVIYDHQGNSAMDAAAYFLGHGFVETKCLKGGIDAYSLDVDPSIPRYRLEIED